LLLPLAWEDTAADKFELVFLSLLLIGLIYFIVNAIGRVVLEQPKNSNIKKVLQAISKLFITAILLVTATIAINASILLIQATIAIYEEEVKKEYWEQREVEE
jgi:succinate dehydrogenase hydrophobic anchor subunit